MSRTVHPGEGMRPRASVFASFLREQTGRPERGLETVACEPLHCAQDPMLTR